MDREPTTPGVVSAARRSSFRPKSAGLELVGRRIRQLRRERKMSQEELAARLSLHPQDVARMERGEHRVSLDTLRAMMVFFEVGLGELLEGSTVS